jgi:putative DNA primase/helicase
MLGAACGSAIMLDLGAVQGCYPKHLAVGEGLETALAACLLNLGPAWALGSANGLQQFPVLPGIEQLTILRENDPTGERAAEACALRWKQAGRHVRFASSPVGSDLADLAREVCRE